MTHPIQKELEDRFEQARNLVGESQPFQDLSLLTAGVDLMKETAAACRQMNDFTTLAHGMARVQGVLLMNMNIEVYANHKSSDQYFNLLLANFTPSVSDVTRRGQTPKIDTKLVRSLLDHDAARGSDDHLLNSLDFSGLLRHLGARGSEDAFALVLDECLKRLDAEDIKPRLQQSFSLDVLSLINDFRLAGSWTDTHQQALPNSILDVLARHPFQILAEHNKYREASHGGFLHMRRLQAMLNHSPCSERMTDVVIEMVRNSAYKLQDNTELLWAEQLGVAVDKDAAGRMLIGYASADQRQTALYYLLSSPKVSIGKFTQILNSINNVTEPLVHTMSLMMASKTFRQGGEQDELFIDKAIALIKHVLSRDHRTAHTLLSAKWLPSKRVLKDHALRELRMASDLGL